MAMGWLKRVERYGEFFFQTCIEYRVCCFFSGRDDCMCWLVIGYLCFLKSGNFTAQWKVPNFFLDLDLHVLC